MPETWLVVSVVLSLTGVAVVAAALWLRARPAPEPLGELPDRAMQTAQGPPGPNAIQRAVLAVGRLVFGRAVLASEACRGIARLALIRIVITSTLALGAFYITWRWAASANWEAWYIAVPLLIAESYSFIDTVMFSLTIWRAKRRRPARPLGREATVDVFITCYNEPIEVVRKTVRGALAIEAPHLTYVLDDGDSPDMRAMATEEGAAYIVRSGEWAGRSRHAKAGNLNNALAQTTGEFILVLDADQVPAPEILLRTLGYFADAQVAFVQTPQWFYNVPRGDPYGSHAPLFYGPIQEGKDGWNAAFFCGSNAVLRREALMQLGVARYVSDLQQRLDRALDAAASILRGAGRDSRATATTRVALGRLETLVADARSARRRGLPAQQVTWDFQRGADAISRDLVAADLAAIRAELDDIPGIYADGGGPRFADALDDDDLLQTLATRETSPLAAIEAVRQLLQAVDLDRADEAQPVMPMATVSVTEDMATAMRLHGLGWRSVYHDEVLAIGLAPEDLRSALQQRLRWAQGTLQVMFRENPWRQRGLSLGQRLMYWSTMWTYLAGFATVVYLVAPVVYLTTGVAPVSAYSREFFLHIVPFLAMNQVLFLIVGWRRSTFRGQQYSLVLFPLWITAVVSAAANVYFGRKLPFVVTPKQRQGGAELRLIRIQLATIAILVVAVAVGAARLAWDPYWVGGFVVNVLWVCYDLVMLSVVVVALTASRRQPREHPPTVTVPTLSAAEAHGRAGSRG